MSISPKTIDKISEICFHVRENEEMIRDAKETAERAVKRLEKKIKQTADPDLIKKHAVLVYSENLYWLNEETQRRMEQFIYPLLFHLHLDLPERHNLYDQVRHLAAETHKDADRYLSVSYKASDIFLEALAVRLPFPT